MGPVRKLSTLGLLLCLAAPAFAQDTAADAAPPAAPAPEAPKTSPPPANLGEVEEIVVSITKREENVQQIGGTVQAFDQGAIQNADIQNVGDLISLLPNVQVKSADTDLSVRGVARAAFDSQSPVAYHINGVYQFNSLTYVGQFYDLQNVAIALGPSGTLYGRNANGGAIDLQWRKPEADWGASGDFTYAPRFDNYQVRTAINIPLSGVDNKLLNARLVVTREVEDGQTRNPAGTEREGFGSTDNWYTRLSLRSEPTDHLAIDLRAFYLNSDSRYAGGISLLPRGQRPSGVLALGATCGNPGDVCFPFDWANGLQQFRAAVSNPATSPLFPLIFFTRLQHPGFTTAQATDFFLLNGFPGVIGPLVRDPIFLTPVPQQQFDTDQAHSYSRLFDLGSGYLKTWSVDGQIEYNFEGLPLFGDVDFFFLGGYSDLRNQGLSESDGTTYGALDTLSAQVPETKRTLEMRFQSNNRDSWLNWTAGIFYVKNIVNQIRNTLTPLTISGATLTQTDTGYAPFANVTVKPVDPVEIFFGVRWNHDQFHRFEAANPTALSPDPLPLNGNRTWRETTLDASLKWFITDDHMVYVKWARGYKAGFVQLLPNPAGVLTPADPTDDTIPLEVKPEVIIAEEIGAKTSWFDGRLHANLSAFHYKYTNLQVPTIRVIQIVNANAQKATVWGAELNLDSRPLENLDVRFALGWLKATFDKFCLDEPLDALNPPPVDPACVGDPNGGTDLSGNTLEDSPRFKVSAMASYLLDLGGAGTVRPTLEFTWTDTAWRRPLNNPLVDRVQAYTKTDLRVRWEEAEHRFWVEAFGENLEDNYVYPRGIVVALTGTAEGFGLLKPRTFGVRLGFNWSAH